ncbi:MAG: CNNM domain-containing protein, partial [Parvularculaceae bacterium]
AAAVNNLIRDRERLIGAILLGNNLVNILASALATSIFLKVFGQNGVAVATVIMTVLVVVFSEVAPKTAAIARPDAAAIFVAPVMRWVVFVFAPITRIVQMIVRGALHMIGLDVSRDAPVLSASEELKGAIDLHHVEGRVDKEARNLIRGALDLEEMRLEEIMIHRKSIQTLDLDKPTRETIADAMKSTHSRLPLHRGNPDNIVGVLHAKDLLRAIWESECDPSDIDLAAIARRPYFVPETTTLQEQLDNFRLKREH